MGECSCRDPTDEECGTERDGERIEPYCCNEVEAQECGGSSRAATQRTFETREPAQRAEDGPVGDLFIDPR